MWEEQEWGFGPGAEILEQYGEKKLEEHRGEE